MCIRDRLHAFGLLLRYGVIHRVPLELNLATARWGTIAAPLLPQTGGGALAATKKAAISGARSPKARERSQLHGLHLDPWPD